MSSNLLQDELDAILRAISVNATLMKKTESVAHVLQRLPKHLFKNHHVSKAVTCLLNLSIYLHIHRWTINEFKTILKQESPADARVTRDSNACMKAPRE